MGRTFEEVVAVEEVELVYWSCCSAVVTLRIQEKLRGRKSYSLKAQGIKVSV